MTDLAIVRPASSDFWKADPVSSKGNTCSILTIIAVFQDYLFQTLSIELF